MVDQLTLQTIGVSIAAASVVVGVVNSILMSRREERRRQIELEDRRADLFMRLYQRTITEEANRSWSELMRMEWEDYDDFDRRYGPNSPDAAVRLHTTWQQWNGIGLLLMEGLISREMAYRLGGGYRAVLLWLKWRPIIQEMRERFENPDYMDGLEYLGTEMIKYREEKGLVSRIPPDFQASHG